MTLQRAHDGFRPRFARGCAGLLALSLLATAGCAQMHALQRKVGGMFHQDKVVAKIEPAPKRPRATRATVPVLPLSEIVNKQLVVGHYEHGKALLQAYLGAHPDDRSARELMRQLTADPVKLLGRRSKPHVVQPGETYSTLAAKYLGSAMRFLILARYNGSANPSVLQVGQTVRVPASAADASRAMAAAAREKPPAQAVPASPASTPVAAQPSVPATKDERARALQQQSMTLLAQGQKNQALARLDQALELDPSLPPDGSKDQALRSELISSYHQRAIVLYRDQKLDQAIALWDHVLAIDPNFEPAVIYRARARELKSRLKQL